MPTHCMRSTYNRIRRKRIEKLWQIILKEIYREPVRKLGIVVARFNSFISEKLLEGALDSLVRSGVDAGDVDVARVPGAFEIPLVAQKMAKSGKYDAVICPRSRHPRRDTAF